VLGPGREAALAREITKKFEEVLRAPLGDLAARLAETPVKGEIVVLIGRADSAVINESDVDTDLKQALADMSLRDAADLVARAHGLTRRDVYQRALRLTKEE
ncbi:MAG: rRNA (cytidine-2'-O-)-methyltransferase, partial [Proteobacteria bacterium]|nr:rRNA (cytidine-2'-O-)-methyltransferase [Pseudomonadota bacterium]